VFASQRVVPKVSTYISLSTLCGKLRYSLVCIFRTGISVFLRRQPHYQACHAYSLYRFLQFNMQMLFCLSVRDFSGTSCRICWALFQNKNMAYLKQKHLKSTAVIIFSVTFAYHFRFALHKHVWTPAACVRPCIYELMIYRDESRFVEKQDGAWNDYEFCYCIRCRNWMEGESKSSTLLGWGTSSSEIILIVVMGVCFKAKHLVISM